MKKNISITFGMFFVITWIVVSILVILINGILLFRYNNAIDYESTSLKNGTYVICDIDEYLVKPFDEYNEEIYSGQCEEITTLLNDYYVYNIPYRNNKFIRIKISSKDIVENLEKYQHGKGKTIRVVGKITYDNNVDMDWYSDISGFSADKLETCYWIEEVDGRKYKNYIWIGIILLVISMLSLCKRIKQKNIFWVYDNSGIEVKKIPNYDLENTLDYYMGRLRALEQEQSLNRKKLIGVLVILIIGTVIICNSYYWEIKSIGILFILYGIKNGWIIFINSDLAIAVGVSVLFNLDTISQKKERISALIDEIQKRKAYYINQQRKYR